jgi:hypothetical protein
VNDNSNNIPKRNIQPSLRGLEHIRKKMHGNLTELNRVIGGGANYAKIRVITNSKPNVIKADKQVFHPKRIPKFSNLTGTFKHSGDLGDLWYSLPAVRFLGGGRVFLNSKGLPTKKSDGTASGFNEDLIKLCIPLLDAQPYISKSGVWRHESISVDLDYFRHRHNHTFNLCEKILVAFSVPFKEVDKKWINCDEKKIAKYVFSRSFRYRNDKMDYSELVRLYKNDSVFVGLPYEHKDFCDRFGDVSYYPVNDFLELAEVINGAEKFIGNQSSPMALAVGLHKPFLQESFPPHSDCVFSRSNAQYFK